MTKMQHGLLLKSKPRLRETLVSIVNGTNAVGNLKNVPELLRFKNKPIK